MFYRYQIFSLSNVYLFKKEIQSISVAYILAGQKRGRLPNTNQNYQISKYLVIILLLICLMFTILLTWLKGIINKIINLPICDIFKNNIDQRNFIPIEWCKYTNSKQYLNYYKLNTALLLLLLKVWKFLNGTVYCPILKNAQISKEKK